MFKYANFQPALLTTMQTANSISKFASTPKPWAAFTNFSVTSPSVSLLRCPMNSSLISLHASRLISTTLPVKIWMIAPIIPIPIHLLSTPMIQPISFKISKMMFVQFQYQRTNMRHRH